MQPRGGYVGVWPIAMMGIFDFFGTIGSGWLSDRFDNRRLLFWYYGLRGLSLLNLPALHRFHVLPPFAGLFDRNKLGLSPRPVATLFWRRSPPRDVSEIRDGRQSKGRESDRCRFTHLYIAPRRRGDRIAFRSTAIDGREVSRWVNLYRLTMPVQCRLLLQHRTYRCIATNRRFGP
jgi:hypothetical protein